VDLLLKTLKDELMILKDSHLFRYLNRVDSEQSSRITIGGREYISLCSNNYLGLATHTGLKESSMEAIKNYGNSAVASRLVSGNMELHERLEEVTAEFKGTEAALVFNTGYMANAGILQAFADERDVLFSDALNHASIIDGCRLSGANIFVYRHRNVDHLRSLLSMAAGSGYRRKIVITDGVFSMDGDIAPLPDIAGIAEEHDAFLIVDDAHATGVLGKTGKGSLEFFGLTRRDIIQMGTYSKALGSFGAYIAGPAEVRDYLINKARAFIYTTALPPSVIAASIAAIRILQEDHEMLSRLWQNTMLFREGLTGLGFNTLNSETPIIPILTGDIKKTILFSKKLFESGIYAIPVRPPTVPEGICRIRTTVTAAHAESDIEFCLRVFEKVGKELRII
jgi:8-amino-7-oxononanoate synthase